MSRSIDGRTRAGWSLPKAALLVIAVTLVTSPFAGTALGHPGPGDPAPTQTEVPLQNVQDLLATVTPGGDPTRAAPQVAEGFYLQPLAAAGAPTTLAFGPGEEPDLYVAALPSEETLEGGAFQGRILRLDLAWTPAGPVTRALEVAATGFDRPNGLAFDDAGNMYVSDRVDNPHHDRQDGRITMLDPSTDEAQSDGTVIVDGLPNGRHSTNHIRFASDGETLLVPNGNPNDAGCPQGPGTNPCDGPADVFPISGAVLAVNASEVAADPIELSWVDQSGTEIPFQQIWGHSVNEGFRENVTVVASGFRNIYDITEAPDRLDYGGSLYTAMNGADDPASQDALYKLPELGSADVGRNYTYPYCYPEGSAGGVGEDASVRPNPQFENHPAANCQDAPEPEALLGWHTCSTGLDFPRAADDRGSVPDASFPESFGSSVFVGECFHIFADSWFQQSRQDPGNASHSSSHKVTRVLLDDAGEATRVQDFVTGLAAPTDVQFGPDGAMYIADASGIHRVAPATGGTVDVNTAVYQFVPQVVVVPEDTTTRWHATLLSHTVTTSNPLCINGFVTPGLCEQAGTDDPDDFHEDLTAGSSVEHTWRSPGVHGYHCEPHENLSMTGAVVVTPSLT